MSLFSICYSKNRVFALFLMGSLPLNVTIAASLDSATPAGNIRLTSTAPSPALGTQPPIAPPGRPEPLFSDSGQKSEPIAFRLEADFTKVQSQLRWVEKGEPGADVPGQLVLGDQTRLHVTIRVRGMSSRQELEFPKLSLRFVNTPAQMSKTSFAGIRRLSINTHGFERDQGVTALGRLASPLAIGREAAIYDLLRGLGITVRHSRRARIEYFDTATGRALTRPALLLETTGALAQRLGGEEIEAFGSYPSDVRADFAESDLAFLAMTQAMLGNGDVAVPAYQSQGLSLHNLILIASRQGRRILAPNDFDMCGAVTGSSRRIDMPDAWMPERNETERRVAALLNAHRSAYSPAAWHSARERWLRLESRSQAAAKKIANDPRGRALLSEHVTAFFSLLRSNK